MKKDTNTVKVDETETEIETELEETETETETEVETETVETTETKTKKRKHVVLPDASKLNLTSLEDFSHNGQILGFKTTQYGKGDKHYLTLAFESMSQLATVLYNGEEDLESYKDDDARNSLINNCFFHRVTSFIDTLIVQPAYRTTFSKITEKATEAELSLVYGSFHEELTRLIVGERKEREKNSVQLSEQIADKAKELQAHKAKFIDPDKYKVDTTTLKLREEYTTLKALFEAKFLEEQTERKKQEARASAILATLDLD